VGNVKTKEELQLDVELAKQQLEKEGYYHVTLKNPFLYRGVQRSPLAKCSM
jgi:hypothetical protein